MRCSGRKCECSFEVKRDALLISRNQAVRFREALSSLHDILRSDDADVRRLQRMARENTSLPAFIDDVAASREIPGETLDIAARVDAVILPLTLIRNASQEGLLGLLNRLRLRHEDEDPQSIVEHHLHKLQTEAVHRTPHNKRHPRASPDAARSESELDWDPLLRRRDHCEVPNIPSDDDAETEVSGHPCLRLMRASLPLENVLTSR